MEIDGARRSPSAFGAKISSDEVGTVMRPNGVTPRLRVTTTLVPSGMVTILPGSGTSPLGHVAPTCQLRSPASA